MTPIAMPQIGENLKTGVVVEWLKRENDAIEVGEVVLTVESEKAVFEVVAEAGGVLLEILHREGEEVEVFAPLAYIGQPGESIAREDSPAAEDPSPAPQPASEEYPPSTAATPEPPRRTRPFASPSARRLAREMQIDLALVEGSGTGGRIVKRDILAATSAALAGDRVVPFDRMRRHIAERMALSARTIPHFYLFADVDMTAVLDRRLQSDSDTRVSLTTLVVRAAAQTLRQFERMNAHVGEREITLKQGIHIGVATAVDGGLLVPVVADADRRDLDGIDVACRDNAAAARRGVVALGPSGTFTISNLGMYDINRFLPLINPPECAILAVGKIEERVVPSQRCITIRDMMTLCLACDHRGVDGAYAARFLEQLKGTLEDPGAQEPTP